MVLALVHFQKYWLLIEFWITLPFTFSLLPSLFSFLFQLFVVLIWEKQKQMFIDLWRKSSSRVGFFFFFGGALCVQMDFTLKFEANTKCNNINYVWSHFYQILVVLKHHRRLWNNIFDTAISRSINIPKNAKYTPLMWVFMHLKMPVSKILFHRRLWYFRTTKIW